MEYTLGYREVIPDQTLPEKWKEITLNTGGSQSTLQDIKVPERAGGYSYKDCTKPFTRNRFIYWRISHDILELVEHSLDVNLANCRVRYKFTDTPILDGISIHETVNSIIILVISVSSIHKLTYPHPDKIHRQDHLVGSHPDISIQSIFSETSIQTVRDPYIFHVIPTAGITNSPVPHYASSWLTLPQEEALFALAYNTGMILLLRLDTVTGLVHSSELKHDSIVPRFLSGIATAFRGRNSESQVAMSLVIHTFGNDTYLFALCREGTIRMWSCNKAQCIAVTNVSTDGRISSQEAQGHILRKTSGSTDDDFYLGVWLKLPTGCELTVLKPVQEAGMFKFIRKCTLVAPDQHLVDFAFTTSRLWAVWRSTDMDTVAVTHAQLPLNGYPENSGWETAILEQPPDRDYIVTDPGTDPRQAYINYIFHPGQFSLADITRALSIYTRSNLVIDMTPAILKERVCMAVEADIQTEVMDYELMDEDYLEIANRCWSKFYSCVIQYHLNGSRPVGLLLLQKVNGVVLLKKSSFSVLRPMEALEHLMLSNGISYVSRFKSTPVLSQDNDTCQDLIALMSAVVLLEEQLSEELKTVFERELYQLKSPDHIVENLLSKLMVESDDLLSVVDFQMELHHILGNIKDISSSMAMLLEALTYDLGQPNQLIVENNQSSKIPGNTSIFFGSQLGISVMVESVSQITMLRFSICRNLLILQQIILSRPELFDSTSLHSIKSSLAPRTVVLTQAYYVVMWICETNASVVPSQALLDTSIQRLARQLKLSDSKSSIGQRQQRSLSLLELFIQTGGSKHIQKLVSQNNLQSSSMILWHHGMLSHITLIAQLIWPICANFIFPEWLLSSCQFLLVQEYVRLLSTWCEWNSSSRKFILAVSLLEMGEPQKACDHFLRASNGVLIDAFLADMLLDSNVTSENNALVHYYLKVIDMFEQHNASDCIIELAETAITITDKSDPNWPTLHSIVFAQHLNLEHHTEAYHCLNTNPDPARRVDCLRQLVVTLFNRKKLNDLVSFPYVDMYEDLERIVEGRARSVDLMENNYYNFLYSFHVNKGNMRKAASIMYEQAMRLSQETHSEHIISKQAECLLACINALSLVNVKYRWIVKPVFDQSFSTDQNPKKKRSIEGKEILRYKVKQQVQVLKLEDIKKEYYLAEAKLKLAKWNSGSHLVSQASSAELIAILSSVGLYVPALRLCDRFNECKGSVLENLASQCVRLSLNEDNKAWEWLNHNEICDLNVSNTNSTNVAWSLLEHLTLKYEEAGSSELHKWVTRKLLHHGAFLPTWLVSSYKKRNAAELLRLLLNVGRIEEAAELALDYIKALLGKGKEYFGLNTALVATAPATWLPFNSLEVLILELENASKEDCTYVEIHEELKKALKNYVQTVVRVSNDMVELRTLSKCVH